MKEIWEAKGYEELRLSSQNLRDQAPGIEKLLELNESGLLNLNISRKKKLHQLKHKCQ